MIWEVVLTCVGTINTSIDLALSLGDSLPTTDAAFFVLESLFRDVSSYANNVNRFLVPAMAGNYSVMMRRVVRTAGRRLVGRFIRVDGDCIGGQAIIVVSSVPTEVPDWLISEYRRSR
ncbi:hypothetical protein ES703_115593 [subsurface metagenome]